MILLRSKTILKIILLGLIISCSSKTAALKRNSKVVGKSEEVKNTNVDWEAFDPGSTVAKTEIKTDDLQGLWKAYKGLLRLGDVVKEMTLTTPFIIEIKDNTYRRNSESPFGKFTLSDNTITKEEDGKISTGVINKITATELTITWKDANYTRYYYKK